jgi:hypothetical protein
MDFGEVLSKAWKIIWKYKILWLFGIFASCSGGGGGGGGGSGGSGAQYSGNDYGYYNTMNNVEPWAVALIIAAVLILAVIITVIVVAVSTIGRAGLVQGAKMADENEDAQLTFSSVFNNSKPFFWRVLGLNLLIMVGYIALLMLIGMIFLFGAIITFGIGAICLLPLCCILIPVFWVLTVFVEMANVAVVVEDLSVIDALKRGWEVFKNNLGEMILMGLVLVLGGMFVSFLIMMPLILTMIPLMMGIMGAIFGDTGAIAAGGFVMSALCCVAYLPVLIVVNGIIRAYIGTAWTLTYLRLTKGPVVDEPSELPSGEPVDPETLPEVVQEPVAEDEVPESAPDENDNIDETVVSNGKDVTDVSPGEDTLPEDF